MEASAETAIAPGVKLQVSKAKKLGEILMEQGLLTQEGLERALAHLGGAPKRLLVDNAKVFVDDARPEFFKWNERFLELCGHYQMEPQACQIRRAHGRCRSGLHRLEESFRARG